MKVIFIRILLVSAWVSALYGEKQIIIELASQTFQAREDGKIIIQGRVTTGKAGYTTPRGKFTILDKEKMHISNRYPIKDKERGIRGGAKMPYAQRITNSGIFIHAGTLAEYPDSHGCIRVSYGDSMKLFRWTIKGTKVYIKGKTPLDDPINKMRLSLYQKKRSDISAPYVVETKPIKWIEESLSYYDNL
jgi:hypothetical protein